MMELWISRWISLHISASKLPQKKNKLYFHEPVFTFGSLWQMTPIIFMNLLWGFQELVNQICKFCDHLFSLMLVQTIL